MLAGFTSNVNFFPGFHLSLPRFYATRARSVVRSAGLAHLVQEQLVKVIKPDEVPQESANSSLLTGGAITWQPLVTPDMGDDSSINLANFGADARNKMYIHTSDQVLFVTAGKGIIATEAAEEVITPGDAVHVSAGEKHWHVATADSAFSHIALTAKGSHTTGRRLDVLLYKKG